MLRLSRQVGRTLKSPFICASCRALLLVGGSATARLPGAVAKLCAARHYSSVDKSSPSSETRIPEAQLNDKQQGKKGVGKTEEDKKSEKDAKKGKKEKKEKKEEKKEKEKEKKEEERKKEERKKEERKKEERKKEEKKKEEKKEEKKKEKKSKEDKKEDKREDKKEDKKENKEDNKEDEKQNDKPTRPNAKSRKTASSLSGSAARQRLWQETLQVLKGFKADPTRPLSAENTSTISATAFSAAAFSAANNAASDTSTAQSDPNVQSGPDSPARTARESKLLEGALTVLKRVLRQELVDNHRLAQELAASRPPEAVPQPTETAPAGQEDKEPEPAPTPQKTTKGKKSTAKVPKTPAASPVEATTTKKPTGPKHSFRVKRITPRNITLRPIVKPQPPVPRLEYGLDRALFNPGVYHLQDPRTRVFNFDPYLARIMPIDEFDFNALKQYVTSSKDTTLIQIAAEHKKKYTGSTSSMTSTLAHFHYLLSSWRPINISMLSRDLKIESLNFTRLLRAPSATFLHWKDGVYAIDADKEFDSGNVLSMLGKSMEKMLTLPKEEFEKYRRTRSDELTDEERNGPEAFHYTTLGDFMMRSQLDAYDPRLPGTGMFDLKTRAVVTIRMDVKQYQKGMDYEIRHRHGTWESYEREYYDMIRAAFLKYSLQVRMGRMDGIFVAFHNTQRIFGFQYISLEEMDLALHGQSNKVLGNSEFKLSVHLLNKVLDRATAKFPNQSLRLHFETRDGSNYPFMYIFAKPVTPEQINKIQNANQAAAEEFERRMMGIQHEADLEVEEEEGGEEAIEAADENLGEEFEENLEERLEEDLEEAEAEEETSLDTWEDVMLRVEDELEDEEHGLAFVRDAVEDALQESGLLEAAAPEDTRRHVDAFLEALTGKGGKAASPEEASEEETSPKDLPTEVSPSEKTLPEESSSEETSPQESSAEEPSPKETLPDESSPEKSSPEEPFTKEPSPEEPSFKEPTSESTPTRPVTPKETDEPAVSSEEVSEPDATATDATPAPTTGPVEGPANEAQDNEQPTTTSQSSKQPTLKELIVKLTTQIQPVPTDQVESRQDEEGASEAVLKLRRVEKILSALIEQGEGKRVVETGSISPKTIEEEAEEPEEEAKKASKKSSAVSGEELEKEVKAEETELNGKEEAVSIPAVEPLDEGEVLGMILTVRNRVNGEYVERVQNLKASDEWLLEYYINELPQARARTLYTMALNRRNKVFDPELKGALEPSFARTLRGYSKRGKKFRASENRRQRDAPLHIYGHDKQYDFTSVFEAAAEDGTRPYQVFGKKKKESDKGQLEEFPQIRTGRMTRLAWLEYKKRQWMKAEGPGGETKDVEVLEEFPEVYEKRSENFLRKRKEAAKAGGETQEAEEPGPVEEEDAKSGKLEEKRTQPEISKAEEEAKIAEGLEEFSEIFKKRLETRRKRQEAAKAEEEAKIAEGLREFPSFRRALLRELKKHKLREAVKAGESEESKEPGPVDDSKPEQPEDRVAEALAKFPGMRRELLIRLEVRRRRQAAQTGGQITEAEEPGPVEEEAEPGKLEEKRTQPALWKAEDEAKLAEALVMFPEMRDELLSQFESIHRRQAAEAEGQAPEAEATYERQATSSAEEEADIAKALAKLPSARALQLMRLALKRRREAEEVGDAEEGERPEALLYQGEEDAMVAEALAAFPELRPELLRRLEDKRRRLAAKAGADAKKAGALERKSEKKHERQEASNPEEEAEIAEALVEFPGFRTELLKQLAERRRRQATAAAAKAGAEAKDTEQTDNAVAGQSEEELEQQPEASDAEDEDALVAEALAEFPGNRRELLKQLRAKRRRQAAKAAAQLGGKAKLAEEKHKQQEASSDVGEATKEAEELGQREDIQAEKPKEE